MRRSGWYGGAARGESSAKLGPRYKRPDFRIAQRAWIPGRLVDAVLSGTLRMTYDDRIEREYWEVLARPRFRFPARLRGAFLLELRNQDAVAAAICRDMENFPIRPTCLS